MPVALTTRWLREGLDAAALARLGERLDLRLFFLHEPVPRAASWRATLKALGVSIGGVAVRTARGVRGAADEDGARFGLAMDEAAHCASGLRAGLVVTDGGGLGSEVDGILEAADGAAWEALPDRESEPAWAPLRTARREAAAQRAVRALHAALAADVPVAVRHGGGPADLLGTEEAGWLLDELPRLRLVLDPGRAERAHRLGVGPAPLAWADAYAARCGAVVVQGVGAHGRGGAHPTEGSIDWRALVESLPRGLPWVLDLAPERSDDEVTDALRWLRDLVGS